MSSPSAWAFKESRSARDFRILAKIASSTWAIDVRILDIEAANRGGPMGHWIDGLARNLGEAPLTSAETTQLLSAAGDVAHRVERKMSPLSAFVIGCAVGRKLANGADRIEALSDTLRQLEALLPPQAPES